MCCRRDTGTRSAKAVVVRELLTNSAAFDFSWFQNANNSGVINIVCSDEAFSGSLILHVCDDCWYAVSQLKSSPEVRC